MISENDRKILEIISKSHLVTLGELGTRLGTNGPNGAATSISRLIELGLVNKVESMGNCIVITQKGMRALKE